MRRILLTARAIILDNLRSRLTIFWVVVFPLVIALLFTLIFGNFSPSPQPQVYVYGFDAHGVASFLSAEGFKVLNGNFTEYVERYGGIQVIVFNSTHYSLLYSPGLKSSAASVAAYVQDYFSGFRASTYFSQVGKASYISYLVTGVMGVVALSNGIFVIVGVSSGYFRDGLMERIAASPLREWEWVVSLMLYEVVITLLSSSLILVYGAAWGVFPTSILEVLGVLLLGTFLFSGLGAVIFGLTPKDKLFVAETASSAIIFPLMFLSNAFYNPSGLPLSVQALVEFSPVSVVNDLVREIGLYGSPVSAYQLVEILVLTFLFLGVGSKLMRIREV